MSKGKKKTTKLHKVSVMYENPYRCEFRIDDKPLCGIINFKFEIDVKTMKPKIVLEMYFDKLEIQADEARVEFMGNDITFFDTEF